jgi:hypothetical protein
MVECSTCVADQCSGKANEDRSNVHCLGPALPSLIDAVPYYHDRNCEMSCVPFSASIVESQPGSTLKTIKDTYKSYTPTAAGWYTIVLVGQTHTKDKPPIFTPVVYRIRIRVGPG